MSFTRRRLPHWRPDGKSLFLTWCLHGVFAPSRFAPPGKQTAGEAFVWMDRHLDGARTGVMHLREPRVAEMVMGAILRGEEMGHYGLGAFVLMGNHVHLLALPRAAPSGWLQSLKGYTAHEANRMLGRTGQPFWQKDSYDHWVRDEEEWAKVRRYIEWNPVKAGLVERPEEWRWSSARLAERR